MVRPFSRVLCAGAILLAPEVALHADYIYVATGWGNQVLRYDSSGNHSVFCDFTGVNSVAVDGQGNVYASGQFGPVMRYNPSGQGTQVGGYGTYWMNGAVADRSGNLYLATQGNTIGKMDPAGNWTTFAQMSDLVAGLALDGEGNLYAAVGFSTIWKFNSLGQGSVFSTHGPANTRGLAFDSSGHLYAAGYSYDQVVKFDASGNATLFAKTGLSGPVGLAFDSSDYLYVANKIGNTIERFDPNGNGTLFASGVCTPGYIAIQPVPEASSLGLLALGLGSLCLRRRPSVVGRSVPERR